MTILNLSLRAVQKARRGNLLAMTTCFYTCHAVLVTREPTFLSRSLNVSLPRATVALCVAWWKQSPSQAALVFGLLRYARNDKSQATLKNPIEEQASGQLNKTNRNGLKRHHDLQKDYQNL